MAGWSKVTLGIAVVLFMAGVAGPWILPAGPASAQNSREATLVAWATPKPTKPRPWPSPAPGTVIVVTKIVVTVGVVTPTLTPTAQPVSPDQPPVVPEASTTILFLTGAGSLAGYVALQWRARRR